jgi:GT2 family glycosyltransferase
VGTDPADVSIVICSRDRPALLMDTIRSVLAGGTVPREVVVVDQSAASNPELAATGTVRGCEVRHVRSPTTGLSVARNIGLRAATGEVAVMIDDDMLVERDWLTHLLAGLPPGRLGVATGRVLPAPDEGTGGTVPPAALVTREEPAVFRGPQPTDVVPGANVAMRRELVLGLGGYDERLGAGTPFGAADDNDMGHRLLLAGVEVHHVPSAVVLHRAHRRQADLIRLRWRYGRGKGAFYAKHASDRFILRRAGADVRRRLRRSIAALVRAPRMTAGELLVLAGMASGALAWILRERAPGRWRRRGA